MNWLSLLVGALARIRWPWPHRLRGKDASAALGLIRHLQTQAALQQLATETYNNAVEIAASEFTPSHEIRVRGAFAVENPDLVARFLLPAAEQKLAIAEAMVAEHQAFPAPETPKEAVASYDRWSDFLTTFLVRARLQHKGWSDWLQRPPRARGAFFTQSLDLAEDQAAKCAVIELNNLIAHAGMTIPGEQWLSLSCAAFNDVRGRIGLPPLTETDLHARLLEGLAGRRPLYFE